MWASALDSNKEFAAANTVTDAASPALAAVSAASPLNADASAASASTSDEEAEPGNKLHVGSNALNSIPTAPISAGSVGSLRQTIQSNLQATIQSTIQSTIRDDSRQTGFRIERRVLPGGSDLLTIFASVPARGPANSPLSFIAAGSGTVISSSTGSMGIAAEEVPLLSVLRDTQGDNDPSNDRLRSVWVLTSSKPTLWQRFTASVPFLYWRAGSLGKNPDAPPAPVLDLSATHRTVWTRLAGLGTQLAAFDPEGPLVRTVTRSYQNNARDYRQVRLLEGLGAVTQFDTARSEDLQLDRVPEVDDHLRQPELLEIQARLALAGQTLGGLVRSSSLPEAYIKQRTRTLEDRGHNWELLRQRAELNGLYFEPFGLNRTNTQALLWIAKKDIQQGRNFDGKLLGISNPYRNRKLKNWTGITKTIYEDGQPVELVPLALYGLDHPKVPLMLVDFQRTHAAKRREMVRHAAVDVVSGVLGISRWGNWPLLAGSWTYNFWQSRHGGTENRFARLRAYAQVRQWLTLDASLDPALRADLLHRLDGMSVNPMEDSVFRQAGFAQRQYAALLRTMEDPNGPAAKLRQNTIRAAEARAAKTPHPAALVSPLTIRPTGSVVRAPSLNANMEGNVAR